MGDTIGSLLLICGALFVLLNVRRAYVDKEIKGVSSLAVAFFSSINVYYTVFYFLEGYTWSFVGSALLGGIQFFWFLQIVYYNKFYKSKTTITTSSHHGLQKGDIIRVITGSDGDYYAIVSSTNNTSYTIKKKA